MVRAAKEPHTLLVFRGTMRVSGPATIKTLLVDENEDFLAGAALWMVGRTPMTIVGIARTGPEALAAVERLRPDLVIMDGVLRGLDGFRVARLIKARPDPPLVVIATFVSAAAVRDEAIAAGADGFLAKDEFAEGLERLIDELIARRHGAGTRARTPETPTRRGSRTEPDL
jgi:CheY-like chemotaxis protein